jgi:Tfp pilus assembly PilM family ATPase
MINFNLPKLFGSKNKNILGIDVGGSSTKIIKLGMNSPRPVVEFCGLLKEASHQENYSEKLRDYLTANQLTGLTVAACLDDPTTKIRKIELPKMPETDLKDAVRWKMRDVVEGSIDDYVVRHSLITEADGGKKLTLVGYAVKTEAMNHLVTNLRQAGLNPDYIEPTAVSLASCIEMVQAGNEEWVAGIDLGADKSVIVIIGNGRFYFSRLLTGVKIIPEVIQDPTFKQKLAAEIQNSLDTFAVTFHTEEMHKIYLAGGGADIEGLAEHITTNVGIKAEILNPFATCELSPVMKQTSIEKPFLYAEALALAKMGFTT